MFRSSRTTIRVVSYNVLSPNLATTASYPTLNPDHLDPAQRLEAVLAKLEQEISHPRVIICLQEVSYDWAGKLHTFFANKGYHFITGLYGRPFNGYMGIAMAYPTASFETLDVDICRLSDTRQDGWPREDKADMDDSNKPCFALPFSWLLPKLKAKLPWNKQEKEPLDPWEYSKRRFNVMLTATLKDKERNKSFCISNYHMPCAFYAPQVMTIHVDLAARRIQQIAQQQYSIGNPDDDNNNNNDDNTDKKSLPYILAGDWNIKPGDPAYNLLTTGKLSPEDPAYPVPAMSKLKADKVLKTFVPSLQGMRSAYAAHHDGKEPDFTNYAAPRSDLSTDEGFIDTLDYIFLSEEWKILETTNAPHRDEVKGPFPNLDSGVREPSDHILIHAKLELD